MLEQESSLSQNGDRDSLFKFLFTTNPHEHDQTFILFMPSSYITYKAVGAR